MEIQSGRRIDMFILISNWYSNMTCKFIEWQILFQNQWNAWMFPRSIGESMRICFGLWLKLTGWYLHSTARWITIVQMNLLYNYKKMWLYYSFINRMVDFSQSYMDILYIYMYIYIYIYTFGIWNTFRTLLVGTAFSLQFWKSLCFLPSDCMPGSTCACGCPWKG